MSEPDETTLARPEDRDAAAPAATLARGLGLLCALVEDEGRSSLAAVARGLGLSLATAHRLASTLEQQGFLVRSHKGSFHRGPVLLALAEGGGEASVAARRLRAPLARLARAWETYVHFAVLEDGMVTYLVKERGTDSSLFTAEKMQLEAYCSAVGKVLLAALPETELDAYLANGPFIALTPATIIAPEALRREVARVRETGIGYDRHEVHGDLFCVAVPVLSPTGALFGAVSISFLRRVPDKATLRRAIRQLRAISARAAEDLEDAGAPPLKLEGAMTE